MSMCKFFCSICVSICITYVNIQTYNKILVYCMVYGFIVYLYIYMVFIATVVQVVSALTCGACSDARLHGYGFSIPV